ACLFAVIDCNNGVYQIDIICIFMVADGGLLRVSHRDEQSVYFMVNRKRGCKVLRFVLNSA
ncbi:MAG: hypothetical protein B7Z70_15400, partial [Acidithiobacillus ferrivorans]